MAHVVVVGTETFKRRNPVAVWLGLPVITLGIYSFVWYYKINNEARRYLRDPSIRPGMSLLAVTLGCLLIAPPFVSIYRTAQRVRRMEANAGIADLADPFVTLLLTATFYLSPLYLQMHLNKVWDAYRGVVDTPFPAPLAPPAPTPPAPTPPVPLQPVLDPPPGE